MTILLQLVHIGVCLFLIIVVLLQSGKGADLAGAFGSGGSQTALGSRGAATVLTKATSIFAILFMLTSLGLALLGSRRSGSVLESAPLPVAAPASPGSAAPVTAPAAAPGSAQPGSAEPSNPPAQGTKAPAPVTGSDKPR